MANGRPSTPIGYEDFELEIGQPNGASYPIAVLRSPGGEAEGVLQLPFEHAELEQRLQQLVRAVLSAREISAGTPAAPPSMREWGRALWEAVLPGELLGLFRAGRLSVDQRGRGLRIKLRIRPPELAALPWEFLWDPQTGAFVGLSVATPVVRYIETAQPIQPLAAALPLRVLAVVSSPTDLAALDTGLERLGIETALRAVGDGAFEVEWLLNPRRAELHAAFARGPWHIFHFVGHGDWDADTQTGRLALVGEDGRSDALSAEQLALLLGDHDPLRLAVLNACQGARSGRERFSGIAATLIRRGTPAVIAMQFPISDRAAVAFAHTFYAALAAGLPVDAAVAESRKAIALAADDTLEWATPVLFMRSPDGVIFELSGQRRSDLQALRAAVAPAIEAERWDDAIAAGEQLIAAGDHSDGDREQLSHAYLGRAVRGYDQRQLEQAIADATRAIALAPDDAQAHYLRGLCYHQLAYTLRRSAEYELAVSDFDRAIALDATHADYFVARAGSLAQLAAERGQAGDARVVDDYTRAIELGLDSGELLYARGLAWKALRRLSEAEADFVRAARLGYARAGAELGPWHRLWA